MDLIVEDRDTVRLDGVWLHGKSEIEAALEHVHAIAPQERILLIRRSHTSLGDWDAVMEMVVDAGLRGAYLE